MGHLKYLTYWFFLEFIRFYLSDILFVNYLMSNWKTNNQQYGQYTSKTGSVPKKKIGKSTVEYL